MPRYDVTGFIGEDGARAAPLAQFLATNPGGAEIVVNSVGGDAFEGAAMLAELERHGNATVIGEGVVASAASLLLMGGREIALHRDAVFMIHDPSGFTFGPASDHRKTAGTLDKLADIYAKAYARASGNPVARVKAWMQAETWLGAEEALALNFIDRIEGGERPVAVASFDFTMFKNPPARLIQLARQNGWAAEPSDAGTKETQDA